MKTFCFFFSFVVLSLAIGCATPEGDHVTTSSVDVSHYRSFAIAPFTGGAPATDPGAPARLTASAREAIVQTLEKKGFHQAPEDQADFIVKIVGEFLPDPLIESSERRILTINLVDRVSQKEVWSTFRSHSSSHTYSPQELQALIASMLAPVPTAANLQSR